MTPDRRDRARSQNSEGVQHFADATQLPADVRTHTQKHQLGGWIFVDGGNGLTPDARIEFYAAGVNSNGLRALGSRQSDGNGNLPKETAALADVRCQIPRDQAARIVVIDTRTGIAATAGTTYAFSC